MNAIDITARELETKSARLARYSDYLSDCKVRKIRRYLLLVVAVIVLAVYLVKFA